MRRGKNSSRSPIRPRRGWRAGSSRASRSCGRPRLTSCAAAKAATTAATSTPARAPLPLLRGGDGSDYARDRHAVAVPYLHMWGLLAGGWMHGRIVHAALESADESSDRRLLEAAFYGVHYLSRLLGLGGVVQSGEIVPATAEAPEADAARV